MLWKILENKLSFFVALVAVSLSACQAVDFDRYPGTAQKEFPDNLVGKYFALVDDQGHDTLWMEIKQNEIFAESREQIHGSKLDEQHVYSSYKNHHYYFISDTGMWNGFELARSKKNLTVTPFMLRHSKSNFAANKKTLDRYFSGSFVNHNGVEVWRVNMDEKGLQKYARKMRKNKIKFVEVK